MWGYPHIHCGANPADPNAKIQANQRQMAAPVAIRLFR
jgi:hypothetical protein